MSHQYREVAASMEPGPNLGPLFDHELVGQAVVYTAHEGARPEQGTVTSVSPSGRGVFVRYGLGSTSALSPIEKLTHLDGTKVVLKKATLKEKP